MEVKSDSNNNVEKAEYPSDLDENDYLDGPIDGFEETNLSLNVSHISFVETIDQVTPKTGQEETIHPQNCSTPKKNCGIAIRKCSYCHYKTKITYNMKRHMRKHQQIGRFDCNTCGKRYIDKYKLSEHLKFKHLDQKVMCDQCGKEFKSSSGLRRHQKTKHSLTEPAFVCSICNPPKYFNDKFYYYEHMTSHDSDKHHKCRYCDKKFSWKGTRCNHEKVCKKNRKPKLYGCLLCAKEFVCQKYLKEHIKYHDVNKPKLICNICGKTYSNKSNVRRHKKVVHKLN